MKAKYTVRWGKSVYYPEISKHSHSKSFTTLKAAKAFIGKKNLQKGVDWTDLSKKSASKPQPKARALPKIAKELMAGDWNSLEEYNAASLKKMRRKGWVE